MKFAAKLKVGWCKMRPSRGMGIMNPDKLGKKMPKKITRKDDPNEVDVYKKGGDVDAPGLYHNIHKKRARIAAGSGEKMRKPGSKGAPTNSAFTKAAKTVKRVS